MHGPAEDTEGGGGEVLVTGTAVEGEPTVADPAKGDIVFELLVGEVLATTCDGSTTTGPDPAAMVRVRSDGN